MHEMDKVVANYEALMPSNRERVPNAAYRMTKYSIKINRATSFMKPIGRGAPSP